MKYTPYGKLVRKYRIDEGITLNEMSKDFDVTPAYLSSIETGRKSVPQKILEITLKFFALEDEQEEKLVEAAETSKREYKLKMPMGTPDGDREIASMFARQFPGMSDEEKEQLKRLLEGRRL